MPKNEVAVQEHFHGGVYMGLRIVYGRAGSGKSTFCLQEMKQKLASGDGRPLVLIVPEQFSLQAEKSLARTSGSSGVSVAEVLSFRRLAYRVFSEVGGIARRHLNAAGKSMLLFRIMDRLGSQLKVFSKTALKKGFTQTLSDAITEFKRYDVSPEQLIEATQKLQDGLVLKDKLTDLSLIYAQFEELLHQNYMDADDDLVELYNKLDQSSQFDGAEIWIDEFSGFTPQEYKVIGKLLKKASRVTICLCTDCLSTEPVDGRPMVFEPVRKTAARLLRLAEEEGIDQESPVKLGGESVISPRFSDSEDLCHLERNFYKYPYQKLMKKSQDVCIWTSANLHAEVEDVARDVIRLCREQGYRYRDIAVTMRNPDSYSSTVKSVFTRFGIPFFIDGKRDIDGHPLIVFILSALDIFSNNWSYESVFRYAKTGFTGIDVYDLDLLENYVLVNGIRGSMWLRQEDWDYPVEYYGRNEEPSQEETELLGRINAARRRLTGPLEAFRSKTRGGVKAIEFCTALFNLLCETGADKRIDDMSQMFISQGKLDRADEYRQVWNIVMDVFSQIVEVLGEETIGTERFSEILAAGFAGHKMKMIPPALDQVLVGSIERARSHDIKAMYILGVNEGVLPGTGGNEGVLSEMDRDSLDKVGLELAGNSASRCLEERFMVYMALATPTRYLWLSYPAADRDGRALRPSRILSEIKRILPMVTVNSTVAGAQAYEIPQPAAPEPTFDELVAQLRRLYDGEDVPYEWRAIYKWFAGQDEWKDKCETIIDGLSYTNQSQSLTGDRTARLYGKPVFTSISRMETYSSCPFSFYVKYGLRAKERRIFSFEPVDAGTFMHNIIDEFSRGLVKKGIGWKNLDGEWCAKEVSRLVDKQLTAKGGRILGSSKRYLYLSDRLKKTVVKALMLISSHIGMGEFEPSGYEVEFGEDGRYPPIEIELPSGECIKMTGRIDRIDSLKNEDGTYLRIIDYKSGNRALKLGDVYYGLQLQLVTYLDAVLGMENQEVDEDDAIDGKSVADAGGNNGAGVDGSTRVLPAGVLYFRLNDPLIRCSRRSSKEDIEKAIMKELRMKGLVLADVNLIKAMDKDLEGDSLIIPARINKDGSLGRSSAATQAQFRTLRRYVRKILAEIGSGIVDGDITISPYKVKAMTACKYCSYSSICKFDTSMAGNRYRILNDYKDDELWSLMGGLVDKKDKSGSKPAGHSTEQSGEGALEYSGGQSGGNGTSQAGGRAPVGIGNKSVLRSETQSGEQERGQHEGESAGQRRRK